MQVQNSTVATTTVGIITGLRPHTTYMCTIHVVTSSAGPTSDPITVTTAQQG